MTRTRRKRYGGCRTRVSAVVNQIVRTPNFDGDPQRAFVLSDLAIWAEGSWLKVPGPSCACLAEGKWSRGLTVGTKFSFNARIIPHRKGAVHGLDNEAECPLRNPTKVIIEKEAEAR